MKKSKASVIIGNIPVNGKDGCYSIAEYQEAKTVAVQALEEIQQYRAIGTPEECQAAMEKQKPKKPVMDGYCCFESYECPTCHHDISNEQKYCDKCGQKLGDDEE